MLLAHSPARSGQIGIFDSSCALHNPHMGLYSITLPTNEPNHKLISHMQYVDQNLKLLEWHLLS